MSRSYNLDYRAQTIQDNASGGLSLHYGYDAAGQLTELKDGLQSAFLARYDYDNLGRLTILRDGPSAVPIETYAYDATGNRTSLLHGGVTTSYTYPSSSHQLSAMGGAARGYSVAGNTTGMNGKTFVYGRLNRLTQIDVGGLTQAVYQYNGFGERVRATQVFTGGTDTQTIYDESGQWLGDYDHNGAVLQQAIWLDDLPVGLLAGAGANQKLHYIEPDHLGTPRAVIDRSRDVAIWTWALQGEAFGNSPPNQDPDLDSTNFVFDMRFPGQRYDAATGLNYNYFRDYDAGSGRYVQSDPIGLEAGTDTFGYVGGRPVSHTDKYGLDDIYSTLDIDLTAGLGVEINFGQVLDTDSLLDSGVYFSIGESYGGNVGIGAGLGYVCRDIEGKGVGLDINAGKISPALSFDDQGLNGASFTVGPGAGLSASKTTTWTLSPNAIIRYIRARAGAR
ncbi:MULTISPECIES: RHS repeat-associated core domain-containing protein [unclassified Lysobacter]|uniref:RHS repeat-associated core domain-containing protein n=1 Tax=unclassified Lysobacter TaxID=2635362 RepID=UPI0006FCD2C8|nr:MULTISPECIES: RHS repeat-associated core domain-containing protein [unclassified Lysobacter]KQZ56526.1 hypothetical protein ASD53_13365 [Lysobacter sp. Root559]KRC35034.1 hypothetical protein ASE10_10195 [Lysobacter sp. Root76]KRD70723.1 hypothetical protein ASE45_02365 [Lysobacter sp. Root96]